MKPPTLLSLTIDSAVLNIAHITDLSAVPDQILVELFRKTLHTGKLTEKVLKLFVATGNEEILFFVQSLNIKQPLLPILPTSKWLATSYSKYYKFIPYKNFQVSIHILQGALKDSRAAGGIYFLNLLNCSQLLACEEKMALHIEDSEVDVVIAALRPNLTTFLEEWRAFFSRFHLVIVKDPDIAEDLQIPPGFDHQVYTKSDMDQLTGSTSIDFSGYSCRYFGFLVSRKKYIISIDDDCSPARDGTGGLVDAVAQHLSNLKMPATPFFFNTLYDPFRKGADFVRGYPFSLRNGVECVLSCGLWLDVADYDAPTQAVKPQERNTRYVDAVLTVPVRAMMPVSGINLGFNREVLGPALLPGLRLDGEGKRRWETMEDIWCGMCAKVVCDHLGLGVKSGLPYVLRCGDVGNAMESLKREWEGVKLMEAVVPFFQSVRLPRTAVTAEDCVMEMAKMVRGQLGPLDPVFGRAADAMEEWVKLWRAVRSRGV